jgi:hypothetical protein
MNILKPSIAIIVTLMFIAGIKACDEFSGNLVGLELEEIARLIDMEVGDAEATNLSSCSTLPIGAKPCGGPWGYLVFSEEQSDPAVLEALIERYDKLDHKRNQEEGRVSTCELGSEPNLTLQEGSCYGEGRYAWNPGDILRFNKIEPSTE